MAQCLCILQSGPNKGTQCRFNAKSGKFCGRHQNCPVAVAAAQSTAPVKSNTSRVKPPKVSALPPLSNKVPPSQVKLIKPPGGFMLFSNHNRAAVKAQNPTASFGQIGSTLQSMWQNLPEDIQDKYKEKAEQLRILYHIASDSRSITDIQNYQRLLQHFQ